MKRTICGQCLRPSTTCYCHTLIQVSNFWPVSILQHPNERQHALGTARIAALSLEHCELYSASVPEACSELSTQLQSSRALLVYPGADATELANVNTTQATRLLFLDGTWRKPWRMLFESPLLRSLPKIKFTPGAAQQSRYRIRKVPGAEYLSTVESIALVLASLEKNPDKYQALLDTQEWMVEQQINAMGKEVYLSNYAGRCNRPGLSVDESGDT